MKRPVCGITQQHAVENLLLHALRIWVAFHALEGAGTELRLMIGGCAGSVSRPTCALDQDCAVSRTMCVGPARDLSGACLDRAQTAEAWMPVLQRRIS